MDPRHHFTPVFEPQGPSHGPSASLYPCFRVPRSTHWTFGITPPASCEEAREWLAGKRDGDAIGYRERGWARGGDAEGVAGEGMGRSELAKKAMWDGLRSEAVPRQRDCDVCLTTAAGRRTAREESGAKRTGQPPFLTAERRPIPSPRHPSKPYLLPGTPIPFRRHPILSPAIPKRPVLQNLKHTFGLP